MSNYFKKWKDAGKHWDNRFAESWPNFSVKEVAQRSDGWSGGNTPVLFVPTTLDKLQILRNIFGGPLRITSAYRSPEHNSKVSSTGEHGPHTTGRAFDIAVYGGDVAKLIHFAYKVGFDGVGVKQKGPHAFRFVHLDDLKDHETQGPRPWAWSY